MKKFYVLSLGLFAIFANAQQTISFESSEGFSLGDINSQNGWSVTESSDGFIQNQVISSEHFSQGAYSFKNAYEAEYDPQFYPIVGAAKEFETPINYTNATFSFDAYITEIEESNFEISGYGTLNEEFTPIFDVLFNYDGTIQVLESVDYDFQQTAATWVANQWYRIKVEVTATSIKYYMDDILIATTDNFTQINLEGINFLHDNFAGDGYFDNLKINNENLSVSNVNKESIKIYPNPVSDVLNIQLPQGEKIESIEIYSVSGQNVLTVGSEKEINLIKLQPGVYFVKAKNIQGKTYNSKIVKK